MFHVSHVILTLPPFPLFSSFRNLPACLTFSHSCMEMACAAYDISIVVQMSVSATYPSCDCMHVVPTLHIQRYVCSDLSTHAISNNDATTMSRSSHSPSLCFRRAMIIDT